MTETTLSQGHWLPLVPSLMLLLTTLIVLTNLWFMSFPTFFYWAVIKSELQINFVAMPRTIYMLHKVLKKMTSFFPPCCFGKENDI